LRASGQPCQPQSAFDCADHRTELDQHSIASRFDYPPAVLRDQWISVAAMLA
jgi:hypothetical protein